MQPSNEEWLQLYKAASAFKQAACWDWMDNIHLFGVQDPGSNQIGYGCIMGSAGEMYGLAVYIGTAGLATVVEMLNDTLVEEVQYAQHCLMLAFDDREDLHPAEKARIKELGLKFRGRQAWPTFRLHEPGYYPWPIQSAEEVRFLTYAIEQAIEVAAAVKSDPDGMLEPKEGRFFLTRVPERRSDGSLEWKTKWLEPLDEEAEEEEPLVINELQLAKLKKSVQKASWVWEMDLSYADMPIMEGDRPFFPMLFLVVDQASGQILGVELGTKDEIRQKAANCILNILDKGKMLPAKLFAGNGRAFDALEPFLSAMELDCFLANKLPGLEQAKRGILAHMG